MWRRARRSLFVVLISGLAPGIASCGQAVGWARQAWSFRKCFYCVMGGDFLVRRW
ncbi:hypothetical protein predicted by Glimmer/Critica [Acetobacter ghanensis]|uniref:Uncharacterized protein n=1 Tax=Acetobacter ghanensis TaxID=431306 RepID=A0A0U5F042_9PROT|nr:hypothetical protein predicted by Glimmer/Critica [Acetobacter ghanensis]